MATDREAVDRSFRPLIVLVVVGLVLEMGLFAAGVVFVSSQPDTDSVVVMLVTFLVICTLTIAAQLASLSYQWGAVRSVHQRVVADAGGLQVFTPRGSLHVPWQAVHAASFHGRGRRRRLVLRVDAGPAMRADLSEDDRRRVQRHGLTFGTVGSRPGIDALADVVAHGTQGRARAR